MSNNVKLIRSVAVCIFPVGQQIPQASVKKAFMEISAAAVFDSAVPSEE